MKLQILLEDREDRINKQIDALIKRNPDMNKHTLRGYLVFIDRSKKYWPWILKQIKYGNVNWPEDVHWIRQTLRDFGKYKSRLQEKDINKYKRIQDLDKALEPLVGTTRNSYNFDPESLPGVTLLDADGDLKLYKVENEESLKKLGEGTKWCTRGSYPECMALRYMQQGPLYLITKNNAPYIQVNHDMSEIQDASNDSVPPHELPFADVILDDIISDTRDPAKMLGILEKIYTDRSNELLYKLLKRLPEDFPVDQYVYELARRTKRRYPDLEGRMRVPYWITYYLAVVDEIIPELLDKIHNPRLLANFAEATKRELPEKYEDMLMSDYDAVFRYMRAVDKRLPKYEKILRSFGRSHHLVARYEGLTGIDFDEFV